MDVSNQDEPGGQKLIQTVMNLTGLPADLIEKEFLEMIKKNGFSPAHLTLDELRCVMVSYLDSCLNSSVLNKNSQ